MLVVADNQVARDLAPSVVVKIRPLLAAERAACADPAWAHDDEQVWQENKEQDQDHERHDEKPTASLRFIMKLRPLRSFCMN